jgi:hypothetical protein
MPAGAAAQDETGSFMNKRRTLVILGIIFVVNLILAAIFRDFIRENVLIPILYLFFYIRLGETCLWPLLIILVILISFRFIRSKKKDHQRAYGYREETGSYEEGRIAFWMKFIKHKSMGLENLSLVSFRLRELVSSVIAYQENLTQHELENEVNRGTLHLPGEIKIFLDPQIQADHQVQVSTEAVKPASLFKRMLGWFKGQDFSNQWARNTDVTKVVQYLEEQLELKHDDGD